MSMTIADAVKQLDGAEALLLNRAVPEYNRAIIMAISALHEKLHREKGCVYCTGDRMPLETDGGGELEVVELIPLPAINLTTGETESTAQPPYYALSFRAFEGELEDFVPIRCCPMCGRLLKEE